MQLEKDESSTIDTSKEVLDEMVDAISVELACVLHRMVKTGELKLSDVMFPRERVSGKLGSWKFKGQESENIQSSLPVSFKKQKIDSNNDIQSREKEVAAENSHVSKTQVSDTCPRDSSLDIWGRIPPKEPKITVKCQNCGKSVSAIRFAPHLDKCMGLGTSRGINSSNNRNTIK